MTLLMDVPASATRTRGLPRRIGLGDREIGSSGMAVVVVVTGEWVLGDVVGVTRMSGT